VINGSPRGECGNTQVLVKEFLKGVKEVGAGTEIVYLKDKKIEHCVGCMDCMLRNPGACRHQDDMPDLIQRLREVDLLVYATPLYVFSFPGLMKDFMDRQLPMAQPFIDIKDGICIHPLRYPSAESKSVVLIATCGFPDTEHFSGLKETWRTSFRSGRRVMSGMICCAGGSMLQRTEARNAIQWYLDAVQKAGREVVEIGYIADGTQSILDRPLVSNKEVFVKHVNAYFEGMGLTRT
jgi:putative NADPH-quinone reductase